MSIRLIKKLIAKVSAGSGPNKFLDIKFFAYNRHSPDSCRVVRQFAPFPRFRQSCAVGAGCRWGWNEPAACRALKITEFSVIEAHLSREFGSDA